MEIISFGDTSILNGMSDYDADNECRRDCSDCRDCGDCRRDCSDCSSDCFNDYDTHKDDVCYGECGDCPGYEDDDGNCYD